MRESIKQVLMRRDNLSSDEAQELINEAQEEFNYLIESGDPEAAYNICMEYFGLEPDYIDELL